MSPTQRVAIVTGAARGLGREHALRLARDGFAVVVNDLGAASDGTGGDIGPAEEVAAEIQRKGGKAVADAGNVANWKEAHLLVETAVAEFGRLDAVVNNAGILRDSFLAGMVEEAWDAVIDVNLKGHFAVLHHAAVYWKGENKRGERVNASVVNTTSSSGTFKVLPGQANYAAAKAGVCALTEVAAAELSRYGVRVNAIAPAARTRLTLATPDLGDLLSQPVPEGQLDIWSPTNVSELVAYLLSPNCTLTGNVYAVRGGEISVLSGWHKTRSLTCDGPWTKDVLAQLSDWETPAQERIIRLPESSDRSKRLD